MRMRKKKNGEARLSAVSGYVLRDICEPMADPAALLGMSGAPVFLEIGAGKGGFACGMAERHPEAAYFAMERVSDCVMLAAELCAKRRDLRPDNLRFIIDTADNLPNIFAPGSVSRIFLNFSDPWPKKGHAKRRLTYRGYLSMYIDLLADGGTLTFKTDNTGLFDFSVEEIEAIGLKPSFLTRDLHASERAGGNIMTEYEKNFSELGMKINCLEFMKPEGFKVDPEVLKKKKTVREDG